jgi:hypothetical protein
VIGDVQKDFTTAYPFLKLEFYRNTSGRLGSTIRQNLIKTVLLNIAGNQKEGDLEITDSMTVGQLEQSFHDKFGMMVQVSRKSGPIWLETTMTDSWTLKQQNEHGRELSAPVVKILLTGKWIVINKEDFSTCRYR